MKSTSWPAAASARTIAAPTPCAAARDENRASCALMPAPPPSTRQVFWPPKPKEFESTVRTGASRASLGTTSSGIAGSGTA